MEISMITFNTDVAQQLLKLKIENINRSILAGELDIAQLQEEVYRAVKQTEMDRLHKHQLEKALAKLNA